MSKTGRPLRKRPLWRRMIVLLAFLVATLLATTAPAYADAAKPSKATCTGNYFLCLQSRVYEKGGQFRAELYKLSTSAAGTVLIHMTLYQCSGNGSGCIPITQRDDRVADLKNSSTIYKAGAFGHNYKACVSAPSYLGDVCTPQMSYTTA